MTRDGEELWCTCAAWLEVVDGEIREFRRPTVEPDEDIVGEVVAAALEGGTYKKARALLRKRRRQ